MVCVVCGQEESSSSLICNWESKSRLYKCTRCGLVYTVPLPSEKELADYYAGFKSNRSEFAKFEKLYPLIEYAVRELLLTAYKLGLNQKVKLLDVAGGSGLYTLAAKRLGGDVSYIDLDTEAVRHVSEMGLKAVQGNVTQLSDYFGEAEFNLVIAKQIMEHVRNPLDLVRSISYILDRGGILIIDTPNNQGFEYFCHLYNTWVSLEKIKRNNPQMSSLTAVRKMLFENWLYADPQRHLYAFNEKNLSLLLLRAGLIPVKTVKSVYGDPVYNPLAYVARERSLLHDAYYLYERATTKIIGAIGRGGQLCIYARKS